MQRSVYISMKWCCVVALSKTSRMRHSTCAEVSMPHSSICWYSMSNFSKVSLLRMDFNLRTTNSPPLLLLACWEAAHELSEVRSLRESPSSLASPGLAGLSPLPVLESFSRALRARAWCFSCCARQSFSSSAVEALCMARSSGWLWEGSVAVLAAALSSFGMLWLAGNSWHAALSLNRRRNSTPYPLPAGPLSSMPPSSEGAAEREVAPGEDLARAASPLDASPSRATALRASASGIPACPTRCPDSPSSCASRLHRCPSSPRSATRTAPSFSFPSSSSSCSSISTPLKSLC
mmetsp:Transcript_5870/g.17365  ORF Transcript_5870/g.17365 Transcript_5870/m.17365 type:complete len:292 (-) Transcript_5870:52-927(-)